MGIKEQWQHWRGRRALEAIAPALQAASQSRWREFVSILPPGAYHFLEVKWQLSPGWRGGEPPRPRSAEEVALALEVDVERVREVDWGFVDTYRDMRRHYRFFWSYLTVPIDAAQEWWDRKFAWLLNPDGSRKPKEQVGPYPKAGPEPADAHEIEDAEDLQQHVLEVHRLEFARNDRALAAVDHRVAHEDEAQDREWDRWFRAALDGGRPSGPLEAKVPSQTLLSPPGTPGPTTPVLVRDAKGTLWARVDAISKPEPRSDLSEEQVRRVATFKGVLAEHDTTSLETTLENLRRDAHPEKEIRIFEAMAAAYEAELVDRPSASATERKLLFKLLFMMRLGYPDVLLNPEVRALPNADRAARRLEDAWKSLSPEAW